MKSSIKHLPLAILFTIMAALVIIWIYNNHKEHIANNQNCLIEKTRTDYNSIINGLERSSLIVFKTIIETRGVMELMKIASTSFGEEKKHARSELYELLEKQYKILETAGYRQLHFHLPSGESFLRFHRPEKHGDNLKALRHSIAIVNKELKPICGFEEGRIFNGYRFVYPLTTKDSSHYGSVEISVSFKAIADEFIKLKKSNVGIMFDKEIVQAKIFSDEFYNYEPIEFIPNMLFDKQLTHDSIHADSYEIFKKYVSQKPLLINEIINSNNTQHLDITTENHKYTIVIQPIPNIQGAKLGNMFAIYNNDTLMELESDVIYKILLIAAIYLTLLAVSFTVVRRNNQLIKVNAELKTFGIKLEESNDIKNRLFEIITHDLRNHFNAVNGFTDLIGKKLGDNDEKTQKLIHGLTDATYLTTSLMNNLFIWSRIQIGKIEFTPELFEASKWFDKQISFFTNIAQRKQLQIQNKTTAPVYIRADVDMLSFIVKNTYHNAIKYSKRGGNITLELSDNLIETHIIIQDNGKGMTSIDIDEIMKRDNWSGSKLKQEIGLGLYVTKKLIDYHQGKLNIDSTPGIGTTVKITIPKKP